MENPAVCPTSISYVPFEISRQYEYQEFIGRGAFGFVIKATDSDNNEYAIKKLLDLWKHANIAKSAYREISILTQITHPNVLKLENLYKTSNEEEFSIYLVTEFMHGNLAKISRQDLSQCQLSFLLYQIICGVNHLHRCGVIHRDLKPENILVNSNCQLKIADFGTACYLRSEMTQYVSTRYYRAPEMILRIEYGMEVDVWSIGCIFYELIRGTPLFPGSSEYNMWSLIIYVVGSPDKEFLLQLPESKRSFLLQKFGTFIPIPFESLLPDDLFLPFIGSTLVNAGNARDLLSKMLVLNPRHRIKLQDAFNHPYINKWCDEGEINALVSKIYNESTLNENLNIGQWKEKILELIKNYEEEKANVAQNQ